MTDRELLIEARKLVEHGWCKHTGSLGDAVCADTAIHRIAFPLGRYDPVYDLLKRQLPTAFSLVHYFNDAKDTTKEMVLAVFDKAIEAA